jgi:hypothetical protein
MQHERVSGDYWFYNVADRGVVVYLPADSFEVLSQRE